MLVPSGDLEALNSSPQGSLSCQRRAVPWAPSAQDAALPLVPNSQGSCTEPCLRDSVVTVGLPMVSLLHSHPCFVGLPTRLSEFESDNFDLVFLVICEALSGHKAGYVLLFANVLLGMLWLWAIRLSSLPMLVPHDVQGLVKKNRDLPYFKLRSRLLQRRKLRQRQRASGRPGLPPSVKPLCFQCRWAGVSRLKGPRRSCRLRAAELRWKRLSSWSRGRGLGASFSLRRLRRDPGIGGESTFLYARPRPTDVRLSARLLQ